MEQRMAMQETVGQQGAVYSGDLTKQVTHLIAAAPTGAKYKHANLWNIPVVTFKWFEDSLRRGMALEAALYDPTLPEDEQGQGAFRTEAKPRTSLGKHERDSESQSVDEAGKRKLRRTASTRLHSQSQDMWQDMSTRDGTTEPSVTDQWKDESEAKQPQAQRPRIEQVQVRQSDVFSHVSETEVAQDGIFSGRYILIRGFPRDRAGRLQQFLEPNGASVVQTEKELEDASENVYFKSRYLLMPHAFEGTAMQPPAVPAGTEMVTEWWVERCIHYKRFFEPEEDALSRPLWDAKIPDLADVTVCTTGFSGVDFRQTAEAVRLMGATYAERLVPSVSVLLSASKTVKKEKAYYANKHSIDVVSVEWLWECLKAKRKLSYESYKVTLPAFEAGDMISEPRTSIPAPSDMLQSSRSRPGSERREDAAPQRLSNIRKKHATPSLSLQASKPQPKPTTRKPAPFVHEDDDEALSVNIEDRPAPKPQSKPAARKPAPFVHEDDDEPAFVTTEDLPALAPTVELPPKRSQPLQELSPNLSPPKGSQKQVTEDGEAEKPAQKTSDTLGPSSPKPFVAPASPKSPRRTPNLEPQQPAPRPREELEADLAALLNRQSSRPGSSTSDALPQKRKNRPLGRSASGIGPRTASSAASDQTGSPLVQHEVSGDAADGFSSFAKEAPLPPSTQLGYDSGEGEQHRAMMEKRLKITLQDESSGKRVASLGTVKDSSSTGGEGGVAGRVGRRTRTK